MKITKTLLCVALSIGIGSMALQAAEHPLLQKAKAEKDADKSIALYWQYLDQAQGDSSYMTAADDFADLLSEHARRADLARLSDRLLRQSPLPVSPLNTIALTLAQGDTALDLALKCSEAVVAAQRAIGQQPPPPERSAKAWQERNRSLLGYFLDTHGYVLLKKQNPKKAREALQEAAALTADDPDADIYLHLAQANWQLKNPSLALEYAIKARYYFGDRANDEVESVLKESFTMSHGSADGLEAYIKDGLAALKQNEYAQMLADKMNTEAPDFELKALDGSAVKLSQYRGKIVLLDFWATWCGPCKRELPLLQAAYPGWQEKGVVFLAVSTDKETQKVAPFIKENKYTFPVLFNQGTSKGYDVSGIPTLFIIDQQGKIQYRHVGYRPDVVDLINLQIAELSRKAG